MDVASAAWRRLIPSAKRGPLEALGGSLVTSIAAWSRLRRLSIFEVQDMKNKVSRRHHRMPNLNIGPPSRSQCTLNVLCARSREEEKIISSRRARTIARVAGFVCARRMTSASGRGRHAGVGAEGKGPGAASLGVDATLNAVQGFVNLLCSIVPR
mmetsp:Transcript_2898/g.6201  ORF Transcript_2898/g.6201 Transcript_2898/m.6201 type:complete len:155 (+) Transcript_2898:463-927(+)